MLLAGRNKLLGTVTARSMKVCWSRDTFVRAPLLRARRDMTRECREVQILAQPIRS
jgi:hypothetical protein